MMNIQFRKENEVKQAYATRITYAQWETHKAFTVELHEKRKTRKEILMILGEMVGFRPSLAQLNSQMKKWNLRVYGPVEGADSHRSGLRDSTVIREPSDAVQEISATEAEIPNGEIPQGQASLSRGTTTPSTSQRPSVSLACGAVSTARTSSRGSLTIADRRPEDFQLIAKEKLQSSVTEDGESTVTRATLATHESDGTSMMAFRKTASRIARMSRSAKQPPVLPDVGTETEQDSTAMGWDVLTGRMNVFSSTKSPTLTEIVRKKVEGWFSRSGKRSRVARSLPVPHLRTFSANTILDSTLGGEQSAGNGEISKLGMPCGIFAEQQAAHRSLHHDGQANDFVPSPPFSSPCSFYDQLDEDNSGDAKALEITERSLCSDLASMSGHRVTDKRKSSGRDRQSDIKNPRTPTRVPGHSDAKRARLEQIREDLRGDQDEGHDVGAYIPTNVSQLRGHRSFYSDDSFEPQHCLKRISRYVTRLQDDDDDDGDPYAPGPYDRSLVLPNAEQQQPRQRMSPTDPEKEAATLASRRQIGRREQTNEHSASTEAYASQMSWLMDPRPPGHDLLRGHGPEHDPKAEQKLNKYPMERYHGDMEATTEKLRKLRLPSK